MASIEYGPVDPSELEAYARILHRCFGWSGDLELDFRIPLRLVDIDHPAFIVEVDRHSVTHRLVSKCKQLRQRLVPLTEPLQDFGVGGSGLPLVILWLTSSNGCDVVPLVGCSSTKKSLYTRQDSNLQPSVP